MAERWWTEEDRAVMMEFEGQDAQIAVLSETRWPYPDGGKTARLRAGRAERARLIAAAPELLEALNTIENWAVEYGNASGVVPAGRLLRLTRAAIAKATGEERQ